MTILGQTGSPSRVHGMGDARAANVSLSAGIMEMLATTYSYIMMAAIREAIQNGCDAVKSAGMSFAEGVFVTLPTAENPLITILDKGSGMTKAFMEADDGYMSFGVSTKAGSNDEAGGLGVGRWAAYGYIRECIIKTTHSSDMVERSYFQYQGDNNMPLVQLAQERPGMTVTGTMVSFPVRPEDVQEAHRAVAWLKAVMQLTMGDSFSVDAPAALAAATSQPNLGLPEYSGILLELEQFDPSLKGVRVYPMMGPNLQYGLKNLSPGSLVVLTNQERGVGGLPFHVTSTGESPFTAGMVVEIPMAFAVEFMPSREALKYTPRLSALMDSIDAAARRAAVAKAEELFTTPGLKSKMVLSRLVLNTNQHFISIAMHNARAGSETSFGSELRRAVGRSVWTNQLPLRGFDKELHTTVKVRLGRGEPLRTAYIQREDVYLPEPGDKPARQVNFDVLHPPVLVINDLPSGGIARFREYAKDAPGMQILIDAKEAKDAIAQAKNVNTYFGNELTVLSTSSFPASVSKRVISGASVTRATKTTMLFHKISASDYGNGKQETETMSFLSTSTSSGKHERIWICKEGRQVAGLREDVSFADLLNKNFETVLKVAGVDRVYFLTGKQAKELNGLIASVKDAGAWDVDSDEFSDLDLGMTYDEVQALKLWTPFEDAATQMLHGTMVGSVLSGSHLHTIIDHAHFNNMIANLAKAPRMALTGTRLDKKLEPYFDALTGARKLPRAKVESELAATCTGLAYYAQCMELTETDSQDRKDLRDTLMSLSAKGKLEVQKIWDALRAEFPMLQALSTGQPDDTVNDLVQGLAMLYR